MSSSAIGLVPLATMGLITQLTAQPDGTFTGQNAAGLTWQCDPNGNVTFEPGAGTGTYQKFGLNADKTIATCNPDELGVGKVYKFAFDAAVVLT